jgi:hypothetical protein
MAFSTAFRFFWTGKQSAPLDRWLDAASRKLGPPLALDINSSSVVLAMTVVLPWTFVAERMQHQLQAVAPLLPD